MRNPVAVRLLGIDAKSLKVRGEEAARVGGVGDFSAQGLARDRDQSGRGIAGGTRRSRARAKRVRRARESGEGSEDVVGFEAGKIVETNGPKARRHGEFAEQTVSSH